MLWERTLDVVVLRLLLVLSGEVLDVLCLFCLCVLLS